MYLGDFLKNPSKIASDFAGKCTWRTGSPLGFNGLVGFHTHTGHGFAGTATRTAGLQLWPPDMEDRASGRVGFGSRVHESPEFSFSGPAGCGSRVPPGIVGFGSGDDPAPPTGKPDL
jgi:hypothetical protein